MGGLSDGEHTFEVFATDDLGNSRRGGHGQLDGRHGHAGAAGDRRRPAGNELGRQTATFEFTGEAGATFECSLDGAAFAACTSPLTLRRTRRTVRTRSRCARSTAPATPARPARRRSPWRGPRSTTPPPPPPPTTPPAATQPATPTVTPDAGSLRVVVARRGALRNGGVPVGCRLDAGTLASCTVRAYANDVRVGAGARTFTGGRLGAVRVKLTARGLRLVQRVGGVRLTFRATATTAAAKTLRGRASLAGAAAARRGGLDRWRLRRRVGAPDGHREALRQGARRGPRRRRRAWSAPGTPTASAARRPTSGSGSLVRSPSARSCATPVCAPSCTAGPPGSAGHGRTTAPLAAAR